MLKKITWQEGKVFSLKLKDDLYTLVQMRADYYLQYFDITRAQDDWKSVDLGKTNTLFFIFTATKALKTLAVSEPSPEEIIIDKRPPEKKLLRAIIGGNYGADLIELPDSLDELDAKVLKSNLTINDDLETIYKYELSGMVGDPEKLRERLINYFDTGIDWDKSKEFLFKGISAPSNNSYKNPHEK
ncbi:hypothetical protein IFR08_19960 [Pseudomonas fluorescens]|uniref:hypothetical protein n=1 Tax=Pseudomonas fluorescens TaxID=294 RepID=UPI00177ABC5A|nr:hypothetical protein [Pseudomonas fluorescens]MBD8096805.1 hypothetical protein [Pseudomonas fluorescens]MBD8776003.1 hypothetical protein [Pseudomonas fluorescens]MBD8780715.1 hypothetical protein [Pseudomonas fluorescens]MBD8797416.1 hypothetical protein [Pseudomonas fluorescens]